MNTLKGIQGESQIHSEINERDARLIISDCMKQINNELKGVKISAKSMGKYLHKLFNTVLNELKNLLPTLEK